MHHQGSNQGHLNHLAALRKNEGDAAAERYLASLHDKIEPPSEASEFDRVLELLKLVSDPVAMKERTALHVETCAKATDAMEKAVAASEQKLAEHKEQHQDLEAERKQFEAECSTALADIKRREAETARLNQQATADAEAAAALREDLNRRLDLVKAASS